MIINEDYLDHINLPDTNAADEVEDAEIDSSMPDPSRYKFAITFQLVWDSKETVYDKFVEKRLKRVLSVCGDYNLIRGNFRHREDLNDKIFFGYYYTKGYVGIDSYSDNLPTVIIELDEVPTPRLYINIIWTIHELIMETSKLFVWQIEVKNNKFVYTPTFDGYHNFRMIEFIESIMLGNPDIKDYSPLTKSIIEALDLPKDQAGPISKFLWNLSQKMIKYYREKYHKDDFEYYESKHSENKELLLEDYLDRFKDSDLEGKEDDEDDYQLPETFPIINSTGEFIEFVENPDPDRYKSVFVMWSSNKEEQRDEIFNRFVKKFCYAIDRLNIEVDAVICKEYASVAAQDVLKNIPDKETSVIVFRMDYPGLTNYVLLLLWLENYYNRDNTSIAIEAVNYNIDGQPDSSNILDPCYPFSDIKMDRCYEQHYLDITWWARSGKASIKNIFGISEDLKKLEAKFKQLLAQYIKNNPI